MRTLLLLAALLAALPLPDAARASCAMPALPADRLAGADAAVAGTVLAVSEDNNRIRVRVDRAVKGNLPPEFEIYNPGNTSIALRLAPGERTGLFLDQQGVGYAANACTRTGYDDLIAAAVPPPCEPEGRVVGCGRAPRGRGVRVEARRRCLEVTVLPSGPVGECVRPGFPSSDTHVILGTAGRVVFGAAQAGTQGVAVTYRRARGDDARRSAALIPIRRPAHLRRLGLKRERVLWAVQLPRGASPIAAEHHGFGGTVTGTRPF